MDESIDADPFAVVTAEPRVAILRALAEHVASNPETPTLSFSALREAAGVDDSGNFNYHLDRLQPEFVRAGDAGYRLTPAGVELVGTLRAGVAPAADRGPVDIGSECLLCAAPLSATYEDGLLAVTCENGHTQPQGILPPAAVEDRSLEDAAALLALRTVQYGEFVRRDVCPTCFGEMDLSQVAFDEAPPVARQGFRGTCEDCGMLYGGPTGTFLLRHPAVVEFRADHGVHVGADGYWETKLPVVGGERVGDDPRRLELTETIDGERLRVVVDDTLTVVETDRERVDGPG